MLKIATNLTSGSSEPFNYRFGTRMINIFIEGVFDGASIIIEVESPSGLFIEVNETEITSVGMYLFLNNVSNTYRLTILNEGVSTSITSYVEGQIS